MAGALLAALRAQGRHGRRSARLRAARCARSRAGRHLPPGPPAIDIVGTGGDASGSFNLSTGAALLDGGVGVRVVKHGNRSVSSRSGSADVLEALGLPLPLDETRAGDCLAATGFTFLFAPHYHPAMKAVAPVRRALGVRTVFNLLGPLTNPAEPPFQPDRRVQRATAAQLMAETLAGMPIERAFVVHGEPGWDEPTPVRSVRAATTCGPGTCARRCAIRATSACALHAAAISPAATPRTTRPGCAPCSTGQDRGPHRDALVLGAALALEVTGARRRPRTRPCAPPACAIDRGDGARLLERLADVRPLDH